MSKHYLSIEQMQTLIDKGLYCSNASHVYVDFNDQGDHEYELMVNSKEVTMGAYKSIPCFDLQDMIEILPKKIEQIYGEVCNINIDEKHRIYYINFFDDIYRCETEDTLIEACYDALIYIIDNNYIKIEKI